MGEEGTHCHVVMNLTRELYQGHDVLGVGTRQGQRDSAPSICDTTACDNIIRASTAATVYQLCGRDRGAGGRFVGRREVRDGRCNLAELHQRQDNRGICKIMPIGSDGGWFCRGLNACVAGHAAQDTAGIVGACMA